MGQKWIKDETEMMIDLAQWHSPEEVAKKMEEQGYERTATAIPLKYAHVTGEAWPEKKTRIVKYDRYSDGPDMIVVVALLLGAFILGYWWVSR